MLVVATGLGMSAGKTIAQIGHAALMADPDPGSSCPWSAPRATSGRGSRESATAVVRDGGLTELPRGSETVLVLR